NMEMEPDIENMMMNEYIDYEAAKERQLRRNDSDFDEIMDDLFRIGAENLKRIRQDKFQNRCDDETSRDMNHESDNHLNFPIFSASNEFSSKCEQYVDLEDDQEEDGDDGDIFDMWVITIDDVDRIRKFFNVPDGIDEIVQPLILDPIHTTPPNDDYVAPATKSILDELLEEFGDKILNVTMINEEADFNPTKNLEELERLLAKEPQSNFTKIQSSRLLRYAKSRPNGKLIYNSIMSGPYVRRLIPEPGDADRDVLVNETFHGQTKDELTENELKQVEADDQAIQTILLGLPEDIYATVNSC
ncbi:hypothetical protein Tco_1465520, partial [Tanacetum coccineum]